MNKRLKEPGRGLFYTRDSGGQHETTPSQYVEWARRQARELGLSFDGTAKIINAMIKNGESRKGDLFLDYGAKGNTLSRPGWNLLVEVAIANPEVTHIFFPRRDRVLRPDDPTDGLEAENQLRRLGITLVFQDGTVLGPLKRGGRRDIGELISSLVEYEKSGKERRDLAQKMLFCQLGLARRGYSTGGRPPYGFRRWLVRGDGTLVRQLNDHERVRMPGHHVVWLPGPKEEIEIIKRVFDMLESMPASRVAAQLTKEGVRTPDHGRTRTDNGVKHSTSGVWHQSSVTSIARNRLNSMLVTYGRRSMGDQLRFSPDGPRTLEDEDFHADGQPKVVQNPDAKQIAVHSPVPFEPIIEPERQEKLIAILDERAGGQKGKPRSKDPDKNPLGGRVYDLNCTWPMYREPYGKGFRYKCGLYHQSHGQKCAHNHIDGPTAVRFLLGCIRQKLLMPGMIEKLRRRLKQLAEKSTPEKKLVEAPAKQAALFELQNKIQKAEHNLALAESKEQYAAIARVFDGLKEQEKSLEAELAAMKKDNSSTDFRKEIDAALNLLEKLTTLAEDVENYGKIGGLFGTVNVRLFAKFRPVQVKKRTLNKLAGGVVTFGSAPPPVEIYQGPTSRKKIKDPARTSEAGSDEDTEASVLLPGEEGKSFRNVSRGDWI